MSLILDALNRAERERQKQHPVPDLNTRHQPPPADVAEPRPARSGIRYFLLLVILLALAALGIGYFGERTGDASTGTASPPPAAVREAVPDVAESTATRPHRDDAAQAHQVSPVHDAIVPAPEPQSTHTPDTARQESITQDTPAVANEDLARLYAEARDVPDEQISPLYQTPTATVPPSPPPVATSEAPVARTYDNLIELPDIGDLPWGLRQEIPSINYSRHHYLANGQSSVVVNGQSFRSGQSLAPDLVLEDIYDDGVIFRFRQIRFKLRALNSWINM